jgi:hypothetical protein
MTKPLRNLPSEHVPRYATPPLDGEVGAQNPSTILNS